MEVFSSRINSLELNRTLTKILFSLHHVFRIIAKINESHAILQTFLFFRLGISYLGLQPKIVWNLLCMQNKPSNTGVIDVRYHTCLALFNHLVIDVLKQRLESEHSTLGPNSSTCKNFIGGWEGGGGRKRSEGWRERERWGQLWSGMFFLRLLGQRGKSLGGGQDFVEIFRDAV